PPYYQPSPIPLASQLAVNGGFEDTTSTAWTRQRGANYMPLTTTSIPPKHCGAEAMYLPGFSGGGAVTVVNDAANITQRISIPTAGATLDYYMYFPNQLTELEELP